MKTFFLSYDQKKKGALCDFQLFIDALAAKGIFRENNLSGKNPVINSDFAQENEYKLSLIEHAEEEYLQLIKENKENKNELCIK